MLKKAYQDLSQKHDSTNKVMAFFKATLRRLETKLLFLKALVLNPRATGAIWPSSNRLAREMASHVLPLENGFVVELGAGTGVVTRALLQLGIPPAKIIAIENSSLLAKKLRENFPDVFVIEGDAADLSRLLGIKNSQVKTIISGLPLRSLPKTVAETIVNQVALILPPGGKYIQFTYYFRPSPLFIPTDFKQTYAKIIWRNLPPAKVDVFVK